MKQFYTLEDVKQFLLDRNIILNSDRIDPGIIPYGFYFKTDIVILSEGKNWQKFVFKIGELEFQIWKEEVGRDEKGVYTSRLVKDLSKEWISYLVQKYPHQATFIKRIIASKMKELHERTEDSIKPLQKEINKIKQDEQVEMDHLRNLDVLVGEEFNSIK